jgi:hypothetical protein
LKYSVTSIIKQKVKETVNEVKEDLTKKKLAEVTSTQLSNITEDNKAQKNKQEANKNADIY